MVYAFRRALSRSPSDRELTVMRRLLNEELKWYGKQSEAATALASTGPYKQVEGLDATELAAWTIVTNALLNLDETITRE